MDLPFLDIFLKKPSGSGGARTVSLDEAVAMVAREVEREASSTYPACEKLCKAMLFETEAAKKAAEAVGGGNPDKSQPQYRIGMQMQRNFAERIPSALGGLPKYAKDYRSFARFHASALDAIRMVAKISNDNRYLPYFMGAEMGAFGKRMNEIIKLTNELGSYMDLKKDFIAQLDTARGLGEEIRAFGGRLESDERLRAEIAERRKALESEIASALARNKELELEENELKGKVETTRIQLSTERKRLTDQLSPFQRQFRKMQKRIIEKDKLKALDSYMERAEDAAIAEVGRSGDYPMLRAILADMKTALEKGDLESDAKIRSRRLAAIADILEGSLIAPAERAMELGRELAADEGALSDVSKRMGGTKDAQRLIERDAEQVAKIEGEERSGKERMENAFSELESLVKESTGESVKINREIY